MVVTKMCYEGEHAAAAQTEYYRNGGALNCREKRWGKMHCCSHLHEVTAEVNKQTDCNKHKAEAQNFKTCLQEDKHLPSAK